MDKNKRLEKEKNYYGLLAALFAGFILVIFLLSAIMPDKDLSVREKRMLARFPSLSARNITSGDFSDDFESYASDQILLRDAFTQMKVQADKLSGKTESQGVYRGKEGYLIEKMNPVDQKIVDHTLSSVEEFSAELSCESVFVLVPNAVSVYEEKLPALAVTEDQQEFYQNVMTKLTQKGITCADVNSVLIQNKDKDGLYYRSDHHWTTYAAYLCAPAVLSSLQKEFTGKYSPLLVCEDFTGSLAAKSGYSVKRTDKIEIYVPETETAYLVTGEDGSGKKASIYSEEGLNSTDPYTVFLGGNQGHIHIDTENAWAGRLLVFKDSYFNCFLPFLIPYFESIDVIDPRYFSGDLSELLYRNEYDRVLYFYNINTFAEDTSLSLVLDDALSQEADG